MTTSTCVLDVLDTNTYTHPYVVVLFDALDRWCFGTLLVLCGVDRVEMNRAFLGDDECVRILWYIEIRKAIQEHRVKTLNAPVMLRTHIPRKPCTLGQTWPFWIGDGSMF